MDLLIKNATVYPLVGNASVKEAIGITDGKITEVGSTEKLTKLSKEETEVIDAGGRTAIPGFIDSHVHFLDFGVKESLYLDLSQVGTKTELLERVKEYAERKTERDWVLGKGWDESSWEGNQSFPTRQELDEIVPDRPVALQRVDCHTYCVNSKALEVLNLKPSTRGAEMTSGEFTGRLSEDAAQVVGQEISPSRSEMVQGLEKAQKEAHRRGVTGVHQMVIGEGEFGEYSHVYQELLGKDKLDIRSSLYFTQNYLDHFLNLGIESGFGNDRLKVGGLKLFTDGSIGSKTAWVSGGYNGDPDNTGISMVSTDELEELVSSAHRNNIQVAIHAIGDRAIQQSIDVLENAMLAYDAADRVPPHRIEHCEMTTDTQAKKMADLGLIASMQPNFTGKWGLPGGMYEKRFNSDRLPDLNRLAYFRRQGVDLSFGSDGMPFNPIFGLHWAVNSPFESQRISPREALKTYTLGAASAGGMSEEVGSLDVGKYADIVLLDGDPVKNRGTIEELSVDATIVGGEVVFQQGLRGD